MSAENPLDEIRQRHLKILAAASRRFEAVSAESALPPELQLGEIEADLARAKSRLAEAEEAKKAAVERYDETIERRRREIDGLEQRAVEVRGEIEGGGRPSPRRPSPRPVGEIEGIGRVFSERLDRGGIRDAGQLAELAPERLAGILEVSEARASDLIARAKRLVGR